MTATTILVRAHRFQEPGPFLGREPFEDRHERLVAVGLVGGEVFAEACQSRSRRIRIEGILGQGARDYALRSAQVAHRHAEPAAEFAVRYCRRTVAREFLSPGFGK